MTSKRPVRVSEADTNNKREPNWKTIAITALVLLLAVLIAVVCSHCGADNKENADDMPAETEQVATIDSKQELKDTLEEYHEEAEIAKQHDCENGHVCHVCGLFFEEGYNNSESYALAESFEQKLSRNEAYLDIEDNLPDGGACDAQKLELLLKYFEILTTTDKQVVVNNNVIVDNGSYVDTIQQGFINFYDRYFCAGHDNNLYIYEVKGGNVISDDVIGNSVVEPPKESQKPVQPPKESQKPVQPPKESQKPVQPPKESQKPVQPPEESQKPAEPPKETVKPEKPSYKVILEIDKNTTDTTLVEIGEEGSFSQFVAVNAYILRNGSDISSTEQVEWHFDGIGFEKDVQDTFANHLSLRAVKAGKMTVWASFRGEDSNQITFTCKEEIRDSIPETAIPQPEPQPEIQLKPGPVVLITKDVSDSGVVLTVRTTLIDAEGMEVADFIYFPVEEFKFIKPWSYLGGGQWTCWVKTDSEENLQYIQALKADGFEQTVIEYD